MENEPKIYGEVCLRKQRRKRQKLLIIELLYEYAKNSTLHCLRYIVDRGLQVYERTFWLLTFLTSVGMCFYLITNVYLKWKTSPVIVSFSERLVPVGDVPFPSITICPQMKNKVTAYNFSDAAKKYIEASQNDDISFENSEWHKLQDINVVCNTDVKVDTDRNITNSSMVKNLIKVAPSVEDVFSFCSWRGKYFDCSDMFKRVLTYEGVCYNFNSLAAHEILRMKNLQKDYEYLNASRRMKDWSLSEGYTDYTPEQTYPRRGRENNASPDLTVYLKESPEDRDGMCNSLKSGYTIYVQHPTDLPQSSLYYYAALPGQVSSLALKFNMLTTDEGLRGYTPEIRQCYFPGDKELLYFRIYTPSNCRLECQSNYTFAKCGCIWFHMPHNDSRNLCITEESFTCMTEALDKLSLAELNGKRRIVKTRSCHCLPSCNSVQYDAEILKTNFNALLYLSTLQTIYQVKIQENLTSLNYSQIDVYFKEPRFVSMRRSELFGVTDFMANCGGLLGLFLGFSFLSLVEIFYFGTMRKNYSQIEVYFKKPRFISMRRSELFGVTDFLANCGGLLGLFLGFSFLSLVKMFYFGTLRLFYRLRKDARQEKKKCNVKKQ